MKAETLIILILISLLIWGLIIYGLYSNMMDEIISEESKQTELFIERKIMGRNICLEKEFVHLCKDNVDPYTRYY